MIDFVIVEDNLLHMKKTKDLIIKYMIKNDYEFRIKEFNKINKDFEKNINTDNQVIYLLDFELEETNAIDIARKIRKTDWTNPIIVMSIYEKMEYKTLKQRLEILDFVSKKQNIEKDLFELFDICMEKFNHKKSFKFKIGKSLYNIDFNKILYIYKDTIERKSIIVTDNQKYMITLSLKKIKYFLPEYFKYSHKACILNTKRVCKIDWFTRTVIFDTGEDIDLISKTYKEELINNEVC